MPKYEQTLAEIETARAQITSILERISDAFVALDTEWRYTYVNERAAQIFGRRREDLIGKHIWTEFPEGIGQPFYRAYYAALETQQPIYLEEYYPPYDRWFENRIYPSKEGLSIFFQDITERKQMEKALRSSEQRLRDILDSIAVFVGVISLDGILVEVNRAALNAAGLQPQDVLGKPCEEAYWWSFSTQSQERLRAAIQCAAQGETVRYDVEVRTLGGQFMPIDFGIAPVYDGGSKVAYLVAWGIDVTERKRAENALENSERRFRTLIEKSADIVLLIDSEARTTYVSPSIHTALGYTAEEFSRLNRLDLVHPHDIDALMSQMRWCLEHPDDEAEGEHRVRHKDGSWRTFRRVVRNLLQDPAIKAIVANLTDITEYKQAEEDLRASENLFSSAFHVGPAGIVITRIADGKFIDANESFCTMFEFERDEVIGHTSTELNMWTPEERKRLIQQQLASGGLHNFELVARSKSGRRVNVLLSSKEMLIAGDACHLTTLIDITERKQMEEVLRESEEKYRTLVEHASDGIFVSDTQGYYIDVNTSGVRMLGYTRQDILGMHVRDLVASDHLASQPLRVDELKAGKALIVERILKHKDGSPIPVEISAKMLPNGLLLGIVRDITERKQAEEQLRRSETRYRQLFDEAPVLMMEVDFSVLKRQLERTLANERQELHAYLEAHLDELMASPQAIRVRDVNDLMLQQYGVSDKPTVLEGMSRSTLAAARTPQMRSETLQTLIALAEGWTRYEQPLVTRSISGKRRHFHRVWSVLPGYEADYSRVLVTLIDITERVEAEDTLRERARHTSLLGEITQAALEAPSFQAMLQAIADRLGELFDADGCYITQWDESEQRTIPSAASGAYRDSYPSVMLPADEQTMTESVLGAGHPLAIEDMSNTPFMSRNIAYQFAAQSMLALPLIADGQRLGAALIAFQTPHRLTNDELALGTQAAAQIALAVAKGRLVERAQQDARELHILSGQLMSAQENERRELARELHDEIGQVLTAVKTNLLLLQLAPDADAMGRRLDASIQVVNRALEQVRSLALDLRPSLLDDFGLVPALEWYIERFVQRTGLAVEFHVDPPTMSLPTPLATTCFRLVQAALTNVERHAQATAAQVIVYQLPPPTGEDSEELELELIVRDNGKGFDISAVLANAARGTSMGLLSMQERAHLAGGQATIVSQPAQGTEIRVRLPVR